MQERSVALPAPATAADAATAGRATQQQPSARTARVIAGAAITERAMQPVALSAPGPAAGAAIADPGDGAAASSRCGMHVQAAAGGRRTWRSACPDRKTASPCSPVAVHAGKAAGGAEQLDPELLAEFEQLVRRTGDANVQKVLHRNKTKLVSNGAVSESALQGLTKEELAQQPFKLLAGDAAALKVAFPSPASAVSTSLPAPRLTRPRRTVASALAVPEHHIYTPPSPHQLRKILGGLEKGEYGILHGHRQAGKSTLAWAAIRRLQELGFHVVYLPLPELGKQFTGEGMWRAILRKLGKQPRPGSSSFEQLQQHLDTNPDCRLILVVDEADELVRFSTDELLQLIACLRELKQRTSNPVACLMVGTTFVEHLLCRELPQGTTSPFNTKFALEPRRFTLREVQSLVVQLRRECECGSLIQASTRALAQAILACTDGHKGLVGACLATVEDMVQEGWEVTMPAWNEVEVTLPINMMAGGYATYSRLVKDLLQYQHEPGVQHILKAILNNSGVCSLDLKCCQQLRHGEEAWKRLVWAGIVVGPDDKNQLRVSSTLLLRALMAAAVQPFDPAGLDAPTGDINNRTLAEWMLVEGVARMPLTCALAPELVTKSAQPAEYGLRADLAATISSVLAHAPPMDKYRALYELAVAKDDPSKRGSPPRLDCFYTDGDLPRVLIEYYVCPRAGYPSGALDIMKAHLKSSQRYAAKLNAQCFMVALSVEQTGKEFPLWGRDETVWADAGLSQPRDAESVAQALQRGSDSRVQELGEVLKKELTAEQRLDLQYMLDAFPPINEAYVPAAVAPVDVLLRVDQGIGLIRFHDSAIVHRVKLVGRRQDALLSFDTYRWRTLRPKYLQSE